MTRVPTSKARELDRAMLLLQKGRISYGRWVETLDAWVRGVDVTTWDYGTAEPLPDRILPLFNGQTVRAGDVASTLGAELSSTCVALKRMCRRGLALKVAYGTYRIGAQRPTQATTGEKR